MSIPQSVKQAGISWGQKSFASTQIKKAVSKECNANKDNASHNMDDIAAKDKGHVMHHFFVDKNNINENIIIIDDKDDYNHAVRVLRLKQGERIIVSDSEGTDYICAVSETDGESLRLTVEEIMEDNHELPSRVTLFQCLPKSEKMELIIQKAVELGVSDIVPVISKNCVVKLDDKKTASKLKRWQLIAENAAKQSKRSIVPTVHEPVNFKTAVELCEQHTVSIIPYENESGITGTCEAIVSFLPGNSVGVMIGPEGGFDPLEVAMANRHGVRSISLGKRILRTETAAIAVLSLIMIRLEIAEGMNLELDQETEATEEAEGADRR